MIKKSTILFICFFSMTSWAIPDFTKAYNSYKKRDFATSARLFYPLAKNNDEKSRRAQIYLGVSLFRMGLYQSASYPLVRALRSKDKKIRALAADLLISAADNLDDSTLLDYALSKYEHSTLTEVGANVLSIRQAQKLEREGKLHDSIALLEGILSQLKNPEEVLYSLGVMYLKIHEPLKAATKFEELAGRYSNEPPTSNKRALASMNVARSYYQAHKWDQASEIYRSIPKDNPQYFDSLVELSWSYFRGGKLRSALSPIQSLHTPYFANAYIPESLLLRGTILLLICRYDEIEPLVATFEQTYQKSADQIQAFLNSKPTPEVLYAKMNTAAADLKKMKSSKNFDWNDQVPFYIYRGILAHPEIQERVRFLNRLVAEKEKAKKVFGNRAPSLLAFINAALTHRQQATRYRVGEISLSQMQRMLIELQDISTKMDFLKYEMLNGERQNLKAKLANSTKPREKEEELTRTYYIQNGFRYWPFEGEYWRDEVGNYQYVGANFCETADE